VSVSDDYLAYVLDQLAALPELSSRRMFGGVGLYSEGCFFGLIADDVLYLRADDSNRTEFTARGMASFKPYPDRPVVSMSYYETPPEVLENARELAQWARRSLDVAGRAPPRPARNSAGSVGRRRRGRLRRRGGA
jgi:DNA transformation protein and related proteins